MTLLAITALVLASPPAAPVDAEELEREALERSRVHLEDDGPGELRDDLPESSRRGARLVEGPAVTDEQRVKRFVGALLGGVFGAAAALPMFLSSTGVCPFPSCAPSPLQYVGTLAMPLLAGLGALGGYALLGGDGAALAPFVALVPAMLVTLPFLMLGAATGAETALALLPFLLPGIALHIFTSAWLLSTRDEMLGPPGSLRRDMQAPATRVAATIGVGLAVTVVGGLLSFGIASLCAQSVCQAGAIAVGAVTLLGAALSQALTHRALGGRGPGWWGAAGVGGAALLVLATLPFSGMSPGPFTSGVMSALLVEAMAVSTLVLPAALLEWSHARTVGAEYAPKLSFGAAPMPGGGVVSAGLSF
ncbi:MAG: hypothetical protein AB1938_20460 [Myxococcota bacterium]